MSLATGKELERRYRPLFENAAIREVVHARTPNEADPVDEEAVLSFVRASDEAHGMFVRSVLGPLHSSDQSA